jgi:DNA protecting protein DprA
MERNLKTAVILSILSTPVRLSLWDSISHSPYEIYKKLDVKQIKIQEIIGRKYSREPDLTADLIIEKCNNKNIRIITIWDRDYPPLLKEIHNPPLVIYSIGKIPQNKMVSIVGTRDSDEKSEEITRKISSIISNAGYSIVSGMAMGIDRCAHLGALLSGGSTVAVLPGGPDIVYPNKNYDIYKMITGSASGSIISEYPPGIGTAQKWTFARRNRIISGLSLAVIVSQAPLKSGAMITARYAIEQNRELFACPGNAFDHKYSGCNELIRQGAVMLSEIEDFFSELDPGFNTDNFVNNEIHPVQSIKKSSPQNKNKSDPAAYDEFAGKVEIKIFDQLKNGIVEIDKFIRNNGFSADEVNQAVTILEISGHIARKGNKILKI